MTRELDSPLHPGTYNKGLDIFSKQGTFIVKKHIEKLHTWTTSVHLGSESKFLVWIAKGDRENIGSAQDINTK